MNTFLLEERNFCRANSKAYEGLFAQGNGYLSVRGSFEEGLEEALQGEIYDRTMKSVTTEVQRSPLSKWGVYVPLIMGDNPYLEEVILNLPYFLSLTVLVDGQKLDLLNCRISDYSRRLDMSSGVLTRSFTMEAPKGALVDFCFERFASMERKHLFLQKVTMTARDKEARIEIVSAIDGAVTTNGRNHFSSLSTGAHEGILSMNVKTDLGFGVSLLSTMEGTFKKDWNYQRTDQKVAAAVALQLNPGESVELIKRSVVTTSRDLNSSDYLAEAEKYLRESFMLSYEQLLLENNRAWKLKWNDSDVQIDGNESLQRGLRFSIYHLLRSNMEEDPRVQICAKGFAGEAYYGRYFWDTEIYMLPFFLYTNPKAAKNLLLYRYHTLNGARANARRYHCKGARYPWQSALDGTEQCSLWEYADNEVHITADVAFAIMHYYRVTGDEEFLCQYGLEMLLETARFWTDRVDRDQEGTYHLLNVMGPDEYSPMTRDNAFTNRMVIENLRSAVAMAEHVHESNPKCYKALIEKLHFASQELALFSKIADSLPIPYDSKRQLVLQSEDFESYADIDMDAIWLDRKKAFGYFASQEKIYRSKCIKQADVIAMMTLFPHEFTEEQVAAAYDYYMPLTTHDSSLSPAGHSFIANRLGRKSDINRFLRQALDVDLCVEKKGSEDGVHIANCGCLWQLVIHSFAGVCTGMETEKLTLRPKLPQGVREIKFKIFWKGQQMEIAVTKEETMIRPCVPQN